MEHRHVCAECTSPAHSFTMRRTQTAGALPVEHIPMGQLQRARSSRQLAVLTRAPSRRHVPESLPRAPSSRNLTAGLARSADLKAVAHKVVAALPMRTRNYAADLAVLEWEHRARCELRALQRQERGERERNASNVQAASELPCKSGWKVDPNFSQPFGMSSALACLMLMKGLSRSCTATDDRRLTK
ncbi:hypothetical protein T484DRAFT_1756587 [Baffinella frigidus]|nr:hypothetical protein T484DRAFT_1756587 [Cryptophyta sp. CCMP2293]